MIALPAPTAPSVAHRAEEAERLLRRHLEELRFSFGEEPLVDLAGFLIAENGCHAIVVAADLDAPARIFLYLHCLGHLALGHVPEPTLAVTYEFRDRWRLPPDQQARETAADQWALRLLQRLLDPTPQASSPFQRGVLQEVHRLPLPRGFLRACRGRLRAAAAADPALVRELRRQVVAPRATVPHRPEKTASPVARSTRRARAR